MIDWTQSYNASWRLVAVNQETWASGNVVPNVSSISIRRDCTDDCPLLESATLSMEAQSEELAAGWYRVEVLFEQNATQMRVPIMTMLCESVTGSRDKSYITLNVDGLSVLQPASERHLLAGTYVPKGSNGANQAAKYLRKCIPAPVVVEGSFTLDDNVVLDADSSYIKAAWTLLDAASWCMQIDGDGTVHIKEKPVDPILSLDQANASILRPSTTFKRSIDSIPNLYIAVDGDEIAEAINDDPDSSLSTIARGRVIDKIDRSPVKVNGETLHNYAERKLEEESTIVKTYGYTREWWPDVYPFSMVRGSIPQRGIDANMRIMSQSFQFGKGLAISETAGIIIKEYKR